MSDVRTYEITTDYGPMEFSSQDVVGYWWEQIISPPCPFCGVSEFPDGLTQGHKEDCVFKLLQRRGVSEEELRSAFSRRFGG